jgi:hypothetical protein
MPGERKVFPSDADQRSELMAITIPNSCRSPDHFSFVSKARNTTPMPPSPNTHFFDTPRFYLIAVYARPLTRVNRSVTRRTQVLSPETRKAQ